MTHEIRIDITSLPEATVRLLLTAATVWQCTVEEATKRLLNRGRSGPPDRRPASVRMPTHASEPPTY